MAAPSAMIALPLEMLDVSFDKKAWHGPNLHGSIRHVDADFAALRPAPGRKCVAEHLLHCAAWKYATTRRLRGAKRGSFALLGSNWFDVAAPLPKADRRGHLALLDTEHKAPRAAVARVDPDDLDREAAGSKYTVSKTIHGIAPHDIYREGRIQLLKRLLHQPEERI